MYLLILYLFIPNVHLFIEQFLLKKSRGPTEQFLHRRRWREGKGAGAAEAVGGHEGNPTPPAPGTAEGGRTEGPGVQKKSLRLKATRL